MAHHAWESPEHTSLSQSTVSSPYASSPPSLNYGKTTDASSLGKQISQVLPLSEINYSTEQPRVLLPAFSTRVYSQLPTPQSPNDLGNYISSSFQHSPSSYGLQGKSPSSFDASASRIGLDSKVTMTHMVTPDSSPHQSRTSSRYGLVTSSGTNSLSQSDGPSTPKATTSVIDLESSLRDRTTPPVLASSVSPVSSTDHLSYSSSLSSPFVPRKSSRDGNAKTQSLDCSPRRSLSPLPSPVHIDTPPPLRTVERTFITPPTGDPIELTPPVAGGEMARIRQIMVENQLAHMKELESRRPDYLKREKRAFTDTDLNTPLENPGGTQKEKVAAIGIMESPSKGRRLKLFQETSEESFEESLMAGGYGRYRTAEWVRQPQPLALGNSSLAGPSNIVALLEQAEELPSEEDLRKRRRLDAFRLDMSGARRSSLVPVELEGKGRVLIDPGYERQDTFFLDSPSKKRGGRRKKKGKDAPEKEKQPGRPSSQSLVDLLQKPNWPDQVFPWSVRMEEMVSFIKAEEENRLQRIKRFLERESDDEDNDTSSPDESCSILNGVDSRLMSALEEASAKRGRGKMVSLSTQVPQPGSGKPRGKRMFPTDPADARTALLAKRSVRTLSYRQQRRKRQVMDVGETDVVCICKGKDDGRDLVQCDGCETWYHLQCIGIKDIAELGREEDPWYCHICNTLSGLPSPDLEDLILSSEPTFVPTDDTPQSHRIHDTPFFQLYPLHDSPSWTGPRIPRTPTRHETASDSEPGLSSGSSWIHSSHHGPRTPQHSSHGVRVYGRNITPLPDPVNNPFEESPFDPASTPSRGIKFGAPFMTPKTNVWSMRPGLLQTPSKPSGRSSNKVGSAFLSATLDGNQSGGYGFSPFGRLPVFDESPIRRSKSGETPRPQQVFDSPLASRSPALMHSDGSPVMKFKGKDKI
ncbi:hypothetical protein AMATHDRAFT_60527 [Amanita thiersii Skay4041]|uniref:PHD-type domain-containing protein n=1 Tax=Amanita thiersii Skay4041 TaxID=703135 RepID=A0A2A9NSH1_9AGAR|nr:hypothetical protein AMATHDRAFT_60527 [Amanita thiersii Skay4041]